MASLEQQSLAVMLRCYLSVALRDLHAVSINFQAMKLKIATAFERTLTRLAGRPRLSGMGPFHVLGPILVAEFRYKWTIYFGYRVKRRKIKLFALQ